LDLVTMSRYTSSSAGARFFDQYEHDASMRRPKFPYSDKTWKMPGWTGHNMQEAEVFGNTPIYQQKNVAQPPETSTLLAPHVDPFLDNHAIFKDPCSDSRNWLKAPPDNLYPSEVIKAAEKGTPPFKSTIVFGDVRYQKAVHGKTGYTSTYREMCDSLNSHIHPAKYVFDDVADTYISLAENPDKIQETYTHNLRRVNPDMITALRNTLRLRIMSNMKVGNNSGNFMIRELFKAVDSNAKGKIELKEFAELLQLFGMQVAKSDVIALFSYYDKDMSGYLSLDDMMKDSLDADYYALFLGKRTTHNEFVKRVTEDELNTIAQLKAKWSTNKISMRKVFRQVDMSKSGSLVREEFEYALRRLNLQVTPAEIDFLMNRSDTVDEGHIDYAEFVSTFGLGK